MRTSTLLQQLADAHGAQTLHGAIVFVMLERPLDRLISRALALGPHHRGRSSPWSHCFLVAEPYRGPSTRILESTVRDVDGSMLWHAPLWQTLKMAVAGSIGRGVGGIYEATLADYDDERVSACGIKWLPQATLRERARIIASARKLARQAIRYDLTGLLRSLFRLLTGALLKPAPGRLYCSAFVQAAYRAAFGSDGAFQPGLPDEHTTPDDIWYSAKGCGLTPAALGMLASPHLVEAHAPALKDTFDSAA